MKRTERLRRKNNITLFLFVLIAVLLVLGMINISSASSVVSFSTYNDSLYLFKRQLFNIVLGAFFLWFFYKKDINDWKKYSVPLLIVSFIFLAAIFIPFLGIEANGAKRWIDLGPVRFQPSELLKLSLIIYFASLFDKKGGQVKSFISGTLPFVGVIAVAGILIMMQPDLGTLLIVLAITGTMFFTAGASMKHLLAMGSLGIVSIGILIKVSTYRMQRFLVFLDPEKDSSGAGYQITQALMAVGSGGIWGVGFGQSRQKHQYLPEPATDSIFAIISEEKGMIGALFIVALFVLFGYLGYLIARRAKDPYQKLIAVGVTSWIFFQAFLNICAILSLLPLTGVPLPFISYGGSSIIFMMAACGLLLNISSNLREEGNENPNIRRRNRWSYSTGTSGN